MQKSPCLDVSVTGLLHNLHWDEVWCLQFRNSRKGTLFLQEYSHSVKLRVLLVFSPTLVDMPAGES